MLKIILLGNMNVGKTSLRIQWLGVDFKYCSDMNIGMDFQIKTVTLDNKITTKVQIWDIAGPALYTSVRELYYHMASGIVLIYDITNEQSFKALTVWLNECKKHAFKAKVMIIGNKKDLVHDRIISFKEGEKFSSDNNVLFNETSALTGDGVDEAFTKLINVIPRFISNPKKKLWKKFF